MIRVERHQRPAAAPMRAWYPYWVVGVLSSALLQTHPRVGFPLVVTGLPIWLAHRIEQRLRRPSDQGGAR